MSQDHYAVLGLGKDASAEDVRKSFKRVAAECHPDKNPGDEEAVRRFKAANEAFQVLSNPDQKLKYDLSQAVQGDPNSPFNFRNIMDDLFGGPFGPRAPRPGPRTTTSAGFSSRGDDVAMGLRLTLKEAVFGCKKRIHVKSLKPAVTCGSCGGSRGQPGSPKMPCASCGGTGRSLEFSTGVPKAAACVACRGTGTLPLKLCHTCGGRGKIPHEAEVTVTVPAGVDAGQQLRLAGQGVPGSPPGDLYLDISVEPHPDFARKGQDLFMCAEVQLGAVIGGRSVPLVLLDGSIHSIHIPPMTLPGSVLEEDGMGVPRPLTGQRGKLYVQLKARIPEKLSPRAMALLTELAEELGG